MTKKTFDATHMQNLNSLKSYLKTIDASLNHLGRAIGSDLKGLDASLRKGTPHPKKYLPKTHPSMEQMIYRSLLTGSPVRQYSSVATSGSAYRSSGGQMWAQLAAGISKAMGRSL